MMRKKNKKTALFIVNYPAGYVLSSRARSFSSALGSEIVCMIIYKNKKMTRFNFLLKILKVIITSRPGLIYTIDGTLTEAVSLCAKLIFRIPVIVDRANTIEDHFREVLSVNSRTKLTSFLVIKFLSFVEFLILGSASAIICRGRNQTLIFKARFYNKNIFHCSESADIKKWTPKISSSLKKKYQINDSLTIGTMGTANDETSSWNMPGYFFGLEVLEVLKLNPTLDLVGIILPSLTSNPKAIRKLEKLATTYGISDRLIIIRNIDRKLIPEYLGLIDIAISTQLNTLSGDMRTTAKLPEYMACGKYVLTNNIGDAGFYLPHNMLVDNYPYYINSLDKKIKKIYYDRSQLKQGLELVEIAHKYCDIKKVSKEAAKVILGILGGNNH